MFDFTAKPLPPLRVCIRAHCEGRAAVFPTIIIPLVDQPKVDPLKIPATGFMLCTGCARRVHVGEFLKGTGKLRKGVNKFCKKVGAQADFKKASIEFKTL